MQIIISTAGIVMQHSVDMKATCTCKDFILLECYIYGNSAHTIVLSDFMRSGVYMELQVTKKKKTHNIIIVMFGSFCKCKMHFCSDVLSICYPDCVRLPVLAGV